MQTFFPMGDRRTTRDALLFRQDVRDSCRLLDGRRRSNQRNETTVILRALAGEITAWRNHACTRMWRGYEPALALYALEWAQVCHAEYGYTDARPGLERFVARWLSDREHTTIALPPWYGGAVHASHRASLLHKQPVHYGRFGWSETPAPGVFWPA